MKVIICMCFETSASTLAVVVMTGVVVVVEWYTVNINYFVPTALISHTALGFCVCLHTRYIGTHVRSSVGYENVHFEANIRNIYWLNSNEVIYIWIKRLIIKKSNWCFKTLFKTIRVFISCTVYTLHCKSKDQRTKYIIGQTEKWQYCIYHDIRSMFDDSGLITSTMIITWYHNIKFHDKIA